MKGKLVVFAAGLSLASMSASALHAGEVAKPSAPSVPRDRLGASSLEELTSLAETGSFEARLLLAEKFLLGKGVPRNVRMAVEWASRVPDNVAPDQRARSSFIIDYAERLSAGRPWPQPAISTRLMGKIPARPLPPPDAVLSALASERIEPVNLMVGGTNSIDETREVYDFLSRHYAYLLQGAGAEIGPALLPDGSVVYELTLTALRHPHLGEIICSILNLRLCLIYPFSPVLTLQADGAAPDAIVDMRSAEASGIARMSSAKQPARIAKARPGPMEDVRERKAIDAVALADKMPPPPTTRPGQLPPLEGAGGEGDEKGSGQVAVQKAEPKEPAGPVVADDRDRVTIAAGIAVPPDSRAAEHATAEAGMPPVEPVTVEDPLTGDVRVVHIGRGEYLIAALRKAGVRDPETFLSVRPLRDIMQPDDLEVGTRIDVVERDGRLVGYTIFLPGRPLRVERRGERLFALAAPATPETSPARELASVGMPAAERIAAALDLPLPEPVAERAEADIAMPSRTAGQRIVLHLDNEERTAVREEVSIMVPRPGEAAGDRPVVVAEALREKRSVNLPEALRVKDGKEVSVPSPSHSVSQGAEVPLVSAVKASAEAEIPVRSVSGADLPSAMRASAPMPFEGPDPMRVSSGDGMLLHVAEGAVGGVRLPQPDKVSIAAPMPEPEKVFLGGPVLRPVPERAVSDADFPSVLHLGSRDGDLPVISRARVSALTSLPGSEFVRSVPKRLPKPLPLVIARSAGFPAPYSANGDDAALPKPTARRAIADAGLPLPVRLSVRTVMAWPRSERFGYDIGLPAASRVAETIAMDVPKVLREVFDLRLPQPVRASLSIGWAAPERAIASADMPSVESVNSGRTLPRPQSLRVILASTGVSVGSLDDDVFPPPPSGMPSPLPLFETGKGPIVGDAETEAGALRSRLALLLKGTRSHGSFINPAPVEPVDVSPLAALPQAPGTEKEAMTIASGIFFPERLHVEADAVSMPALLHVASAIRMPRPIHVAMTAVFDRPVRRIATSGDKSFPVLPTKPAAPAPVMVSAPVQPLPPAAPQAPAASGLVVENVRFGLSRSLKEIVIGEGIGDAQIARILAVLEEGLDAHGGRVTDMARLTRADGRLMALELVEENGARVGAFVGPDGSVSALYAPASGAGTDGAPVAPVSPSPVTRKPDMLVPPVLAQTEKPAPEISAPAQAPVVAAQVPSPVDGMPPRVIPLGASSLPVRELPGISAWTTQIETVRGGESMSRLLARAGVQQPDRTRLVAALRRRVDPGVLSAGQEISIHRHGADIAVRMAMPNSSDFVLAWKEKGNYRVLTASAADLDGVFRDPSRLVDRGHDIAIPQPSSLTQKPKAAPAEESLPVVVAGDDENRLPPAPTTPVQVATIDQPSGPAFAEDAASPVRVMPLPNGNGISSMGHVRRAVQPPVVTSPPASPVRQAPVDVQAAAPVAVPAAPRPSSAQPVEPLPQVQEARAPRLIPLDEPAPRGGAAPSVVRARPTGAAVYIQFSTVGSAEDAWLEVTRLRLALPRSVLAGLDLYAEPDGSGSYRVVASGGNSAPDLEGICQVISSRYGESCHLVNHLWTDNPN